MSSMGVVFNPTIDQWQRCQLELGQVETLKPLRPLKKGEDYQKSSAGRQRQTVFWNDLLFVSYSALCRRSLCGTLNRYYRA
jgi:hypothetical protein